MVDDFDDYLERETFKSTRDHKFVIQNNLLDDFKEVRIDESLSDLILYLSCSMQKRTILKEQKATLKDPKWIVKMIEGTGHRYEEVAKHEFKITYPTGKTASIFFLNVPMTRDCYVECEFSDLEPGTSNGIFLVVDPRTYGKNFGVVAGQTLPASRDERHDRKIGEGWMAIMDYDPLTTHATPMTLAWSQDIEPWGKFRLSRSAVYLKLHKGNQIIMKAMTRSHFEVLYAGFYTYSYAAEEPRFTIIKNLKCGNY